MSDTSRRYHAIKQGLMQFYRPRPLGHREQHLNTLVAMICGLVGGHHAHLPTIADHAPSNGATQESLIKRFRRFLQHEAQTVDTWFLPVAQALLAALAHQPIYVVMDGSVVGRGCLALMVSVVYHGRALPLCWVVVAAPKGHFPEATHRALLAQVQQLMPPDATVIFLGDGNLTGSTSRPICAAWGGSMSVVPPPTFSSPPTGSSSPSARWPHSRGKRWRSPRPG